MKKIYTLEYNKTKECEILIFGDDLKFWSFFKMKHWICTFFKNHIYSIMTNKKKWCIGENLNILYNKLPKNSLKNSFACKSCFLEKQLAVFFQSNPFGS